MKNILYVVLPFLGLVVFSTTVLADKNKGQKIYLKKLKASCGINGDQFARKHTQKEWEDIHAAGKFSDELMKIGTVK
jgi:hypothetical protein